MTRHAIGLGLLAAVAALTGAPVASAVAASAIVPPENSAAAQYTEAIPTAGGERQSGGGGGKEGHRSPTQAIGADDAHKLESQGKSGRELAKIVADTAPATSTPGATAQPHTTTPQPSGPRPGGGAPGSQSTQAGMPAPPGKAVSPPHEAKTAPSGSSGIGETIAAATGTSSSGQLGLLLPLAIAAAIVWSLVYLQRHRQQPK